MRLDELADLNMGQSPGGDSLNEITGMEFHQGKIYFGDLSLGASPTKTNAPTKKAKPGDVLICVRAPVGVVNLTDREICIGRGLAALTPKRDVPTRFLLHLLRYHQRTVEQIATGSTFASITTDQLRAIEFPVPDRGVRLRIAGVLGSIDEKIELNRKKIAELEALAKTIYDYWFVQFDFPDKNGKPYKSSGGKMVWNEQLKREVPEGWEAWSISDSGTFNRGVSYSKEDEVAKGDTNSIPVYRGNNIVGGYVVHDSNEVFIPESMATKSQTLHKGQVMIAMSSGSKDHVGKAGLVTLSSPTRAFGAFCTSFSPKDEFRHIVYNFFRSAAYRAYIKQICSGTGINNLKLEHLNAKLFAVPDNSSILSTFNDIEEPIYSQIMRLDEESSTLQNLRDTLLPLLMNGQVEVAG